MLFKKSKKKKILIVEDETPLSKLLCEELLDKGYQVICAANGEVGLQEAEEMKPDLILLDILMPAMDGITMLQEIRKTEWGKEVKVIIISNLIYEESEDKLEGLNIDEYLVKSNETFEKVMQSVKKLIG